MLDPEQSDELALEAIKLLYQLARTVERNPTMHDIFKAPSLLRRRKMLFAFQYRLMQARPADGGDEMFTDVKGEVCSGNIAQSCAQTWWWPVDCADRLC